MNVLGKNKLHRRTLLTGAGSIALALPWLECMGEKKLAHAQAGTTAKRFLSVFQPGGTIAAQYWPSGTPEAPILSPILKPLESVKSKLLVLRGLDMKSAVGEQHQAGIIAFLTGSTQGPETVVLTDGGYSYYPSIDQIIATKISKNIKAKASLQMAVRWATGSSHGLLHPINAANFEDSANLAPIPPRLDPQQIFDDLFGTLTPAVAPTPGANTAPLERKKSILDFVIARYAELSARLGPNDRAKLEQHLTKLREIELGLSKGPVGSATCRAPVRANTTGYNPTTGLNSNEEGSIVDVSTDSMIPTVGKFMMDMMVMALACDITAVGSLQWSDTEAKHTFPWLNLHDHQHAYEHDDSPGGMAACTTIATWYSEMHNYLLGAMDQVDMGGHTLLDESVVFFGSELSLPSTHMKDNMPFLLAGQGGGLRGGRLLNFNATSHNNLLVSILNLFGDPRTSYGDPQFCTGALNGIT